MPVADLLMRMQSGCEKDCKGSVIQDCGAGAWRAAFGEAASQAPGQGLVSNIHGALHTARHKTDEISRMLAHAFLGPTDGISHVVFQITSTISSLPHQFCHIY
jgi:hypothetical protein